MPCLPFRPSKLGFEPRNFLRICALLLGSSILLRGQLLLVVLSPVSVAATRAAALTPCPCFAHVVALSAPALPPFAAVVASILATRAAALPPCS
jgi:hypothetical protein